MCSGFLVIDVFPLLLCVFLLDGSTSVVVGLSPCTALLDCQSSRAVQGEGPTTTLVLPSKGLRMARVTETCSLV